MARELLFKNLPFVPEKGEVIYVEQSYHEKLNKFIRSNYQWLQKTFAHHHLRFCYLPLRAEEIVTYQAPYLSNEERQAKIRLLPSLSDYAVGDADISPSLVFAWDNPDVKAPCDITLQSVAIKTKWHVPTWHTFSLLAKEIEQVIRDHRFDTKISESQSGEGESLQIRFSLDVTGESTTRFRIGDSDDAESNFDHQSQQLIEEIRERVEALRNRGINTMFLHNIIDESEHLSRLRITKDNRIFLVDYNNMEIRLSVLPKAVFLLF